MSVSVYVSKNILCVRLGWNKVWTRKNKKIGNCYADETRYPNNMIVDAILMQKIYI